MTRTAEERRRGWWRALVGATFCLSLAACGAGPVAESKAAVELDYGDYSSTTLTTKAWEALEAKDSIRPRSRTPARR